MDFNVKTTQILATLHNQEIHRNKLCFSSKGWCATNKFIFINRLVVSTFYRSLENFVLCDTRGSPSVTCIKRERVISNRE